MTTRAVEQFAEWESSPFRDGYRGLHDLAEGEFSGIVEAGGAKLCMLNGTVVGILDGDIDSFEGATGTAYEAPSPALPLLALMQERNDEVRAKYYSEDTPLTEVDDTLSDGGFTGFVELSENVLSGDYYVVYHRGRSMAVAWVGNSGQLLTDDEAFEQADDEVGIFHVRPAEIDPVEIPDVEPDDAGEDDVGAGGVAGDVTDESSDTGDGVVDESSSVDDSTAEDPPVDTDETAAPDRTAGTDRPAADDSTDAESAGASAVPGDDDAESHAGADAGADPTTEEPAPDSGADTTTPAAREGDDAVESGAQESTARASDERSRSDDVGADTDPVDTDRAGSAADDSSDRSARRSESARNSRRDDRDEPTGSERDGVRDDDSRTEASTGRARERDRDANDSSPSPRREGPEERDRDRTERSTEPDRQRSRTEGSTEREPDRARDRTDRAADTDRDRTDRTGRSTENERERSARTEGPAETDAADRRETNRTTDSRPVDPEPETSPERTGSAGSQGPAADTNGPTGQSAGPARSPDAGASGGVGASSSGTPEQLATHSIPSLDPAKTTSRQSGGESSSASARTADDSPSRGTGAAPSTSEERPPSSTNGPAEPGGGRQNGRQAGRDRSSADPANRDATDSRRERANGDARSAGAGPDTSDARVADLEAELEDREAEIERLEADLANAESERDDLRAELDALRSERDDLQSQLDRVESERDRLESERDELATEVDDLEAEVGRLESQLEDIEAEFGDAVDAERRMSPGEALDQTNLFVRYESKGEATLETAHAGEATREEVAQNLGLEYHTQFDRDNVSVGGRPFDEFLRETIQFRFVTWVVNHLLYEIRGTGKVAELQALYDAIPKIDRAELNGVVSTEYTEDGQERRSQESFDVVMRDRMGNPLLTANMNDSRQAASESMMSSLVTASSHVGESTETLGASFLVTSSFFEPGALETAAEATSGGLLSRDKRESFVKLSRKQGYHLCLVEAREEQFHLAVPEL
ncbi:DUF7527 domain-containing protein [Halosimplex sp. J119]